ncbi:hypothetical protein [Corynebacterium sp.]|uniref:hypothetical protein n=1 Tax=Corynebacterium sp. TaxID=1720 RepID=UPI0025BBF325|nr:hypothetical protein [Corynebacterium sp.]
MTCLTLLTLRVPAGRGTDVVRYYGTAGILEASGATSTTLGLRSAADDSESGEAGEGCEGGGTTDTVLVVAEWPDRQAYADWQADPVRESFSAGILACAGDIVSATSEIFEIV